MTATASRYTRDDLYNYEEVKEIVGCSYGHVVDNALSGNITQVRLPLDHKVYIPKYEIDPLRGRRRIGSKESKALIRAAREANRDFVAEEQEYGDPIEHIESLPVSHVMKTLFDKSPSGFMEAFKEITGVKVLGL